MSRASAVIVYDGDALREGMMDVRDLAPALLAFGEAVERTNGALNGDRAVVSVKVKSDFRTGSFQVDLEVVQTALRDAVALIAIAEMASAGTLLDAIAKVIEIAKFLRKEPPRNVTQISIGQVQIVNMAGEQASFEPTTFKLYENKPLRRAIRKAVEPLESEGVDTFEIRPPSQPPARVAKEEVPYLDVPEDAGEEIQGVQRMRVKIIRVVFEPSKKWILYDGERKIFVRITDAAFWERVDKYSESFMKGDELVVNMHSRQVQGADGKLRWEHDVIKVLKHDKATDQQHIPFPEDDGDQPEPEEA
jgi:hypothetical protein